MVWIDEQSPKELIIPPLETLEHGEASPFPALFEERARVQAEQQRIKTLYLQRKEELETAETAAADESLEADPAKIAQARQLVGELQPIVERLHTRLIELNSSLSLFQARRRHALEPLMAAMGEYDWEVRSYHSNLKRIKTSGAAGNHSTWIDCQKHLAYLTVLSEWVKREYKRLFGTDYTNQFGELFL